MTAAALLGLAAGAYTVAAWSVRPGFYDGFSQQTPYNWVSPPPALTPGNLPPKSGTCTANVVNGEVEPKSCFTDDGQAILSFVPGAFAPPVTGTSVTVDIKPVDTYPAPQGFGLGTNVYLVSANSKLVKPAVITLRYSDAVQAPGYVYTSESEAGPWRSIGASNVAAPFTVAQRTSTLGYFAGGIPGGHAGGGSTAVVGGGQTLPIIVAGVIVLVILAGIPLALLRRRGAADGEPAIDPPARRPPPPRRDRPRRR